MASIFETRSSPSRLSRATKWATDSWAWEILSCAMSILATVTVAVVAFIYDKEPLPRLPYNIGLNSIISIIGTVSKSALLLTITSCISQYKWVNFADAFGSLRDLQRHDEASRGPWGSFMLLVSRKGIYWVKIGALATVLSIAFDPFYQALIRIELRPKYRDDPDALVKRALSFNTTNYHSDDNDGYFSKDWFRAITNAVASESVALETNPACPTGNCTFPVFSSLAFCSNCLNITQFLQTNFLCEHLDGEQVCTYEIPFPNSSHSYDQSPDKSIIHSDFNFEVWKSDEQTDPNDYSFNRPSLGTIFPSYLDLFDGPKEAHLSDGEIIPNSFFIMALVKFASRTRFAHFDPLSTAHICALSVCAKEYSVSMTSGRLQIQILSTSYSKLTRYNKHYHAGIVNSSCTWGIGNSSYTFTFLNDTNNFAVVTNTTEKYLSGRLADFTFEENLSVYLRNLFEVPNNTRPVGTPESMSEIFTNGFNSSSNIPNTMDRVAAALTNRLRDISNFTIQGQSGSMELYIRVSWGWLFLPVLTVLFGTLLLISAMVMTRKHQLPVWKTSELALLFHDGLDLSTSTPVPSGGGGDADAEGGGSFKTLKASEMEALASKLQVGFCRDGERGGLKLERKSEQEQLQVDRFV